MIGLGVGAIIIVAEIIRWINVRAIKNKYKAAAESALEFVRERKRKDINNRRGKRAYLPTG